MDPQDDASEHGPVAPHAASWSQDRRLKFIEFRLRWDGRVNRGDLMEFFGISAPQASADLAKYNEAAPMNLAYDLKAKSYMRTAGFTPMYARSALGAYLNELLALSTDLIEPKASFIGWHPDVAVAPIPCRLLDERTLSVILQAIREQRRVSMAYQGMKRPEPVQREISPHALGFDGFRWHVRAYCDLREKYQDFVLGRMTNASLSERSVWTGAEDAQWNHLLTLEIGPHSDLSAAAKRAISMEYGMTDGTLELTCREALLFYALRRLGLQAEQEATMAAPAQQIILLNRDVLQPYLNNLRRRESI
ncbi:WYL domain-containing protein [Variovorax sp. DT-64]|uniref:WYL domain-containing protein n=1 Tax=Variovorax sp. DT-64 TaxID=3396160 RepID=UPI003F1A37C9